ncbi:MAG: hypothetical protein NC089_10990 [Bacteroides sp.]|nr:hypothetical protein [Bacteroides sp.]MCM1550377.1 hypothetical protein [Clostridium sp.]
MKLKTAKILSIIFASVQFFTVLLTVLITLNQYAIKQNFLGVTDTGVLELHTIPVSAFCQSIIPLILYLAVVFILFAGEHKNTRVLAGAMLFLGVMLNGASYYIPSIENMLVGRTMGTNALVSLSTLNQMFTLTCTPLRVIAFALFCFVIGGYWGMQKEEQTV